ncbi:MAG: ribosome silencing factor [Bacilli bacterium]
MKQTKLNMIVKAIEEKKGEDIVTLNIEEKSPFWSYAIIATMRNNKMASSIVDEIQKNLALINEEVRRIDGVNSSSSWVLVDCYDMVVHIFTEEERKRVNLDDLLSKKGK